MPMIKVDKRRTQNSIIISSILLIISQSIMSELRTNTVYITSKMVSSITLKNGEPITLKHVCRPVHQNVRRAPIPRGNFKMIDIRHLSDICQILEFIDNKLLPLQPSRSEKKVINISKTVNTRQCCQMG